VEKCDAHGFWGERRKTIKTSLNKIVQERCWSWPESISRL